MANELEHIDDTGLTIYAKPTPIVASPWVTDAIALTEVSTTGYYSADVVSPAAGYVVYSQAGGSAVLADEKLGTISTEVAVNNTLIAAVSTEISALNDVASSDVQTAAEAAIDAKLPDGETEIAAAGSTATNLDQVNSAGIGSTYSMELVYSYENNDVKITATFFKQGELLTTLGSDAVLTLVTDTGYAPPIVFMPKVGDLLAGEIVNAKASLTSANWARATLTGTIDGVTKKFGQVTAIKSNNDGAVNNQVTFVTEDVR